MTAKQIKIQLNARDYRTFRHAIGSANPFRTPGQIVRAMINAYCVRAIGVGIARVRSPNAQAIVRPPAVSRRPKVAGKPARVRKCRTCKTYKSLDQFAGSKYHTVCSTCIQHADPSSDKRPATPSSYLASQYHYRKVRKEYMDRMAAGDPDLPSWAEYRKTQHYRLPQSVQEYYNRLKD